MGEWEWMNEFACPCCMARALWAGRRTANGRVAYCGACEVRLVLYVTRRDALSGAELSELADVRHIAGGGSNSAVGAF